MGGRPNRTMKKVVALQKPKPANTISDTSLTIMTLLLVLLIARFISPVAALIPPIIIKCARTMLSASLYDQGIEKLREISGKTGVEKEELMQAFLMWINSEDFNPAALTKHQKQAILKNATAEQPDSDLQMCINAAVYCIFCAPLYDQTMPLPSNLIRNYAQRITQCVDAIKKLKQGKSLTVNAEYLNEIAPGIMTRHELYVTEKEGRRQSVYGLIIPYATLVRIQRMLNGILPDNKQIKTFEIKPGGTYVFKR
jgi:hypothetical protein